MDNHQEKTAPGMFPEMCEARNACVTNSTPPEL